MPVPSHKGITMMYQIARSYILIWQSFQSRIHSKYDDSCANPFLKFRHREYFKPLNILTHKYEISIYKIIYNKYVIFNLFNQHMKLCDADKNMSQTTIGVELSDKLKR